MVIRMLSKLSCFAEVQMHREDSKEIKKGGKLAGMLDVFSNVLDIEVAQWEKRNCFLKWIVGKKLRRWNYGRRISSTYVSKADFDEALRGCIHGTFRHEATFLHMMIYYTGAIFWGLQSGERPYCSPHNSKTMIAISYRAATSFQASCLAETSSCCKPALAMSSRAIHCTQQLAIQRKSKCKPFVRNQRTQMLQTTEFGHPELYELH
jgi:hypothetical protein